MIEQKAVVVDEAVGGTGVEECTVVVVVVGSIEAVVVVSIVVAVKVEHLDHPSVPNSS